MTAAAGVSVEVDIYLAGSGDTRGPGEVVLVVVVAQIRDPDDVAGPDRPDARGAAIRPGSSGTGARGWAAFIRFGRILPTIHRSPGESMILNKLAAPKAYFRRLALKKSQSNRLASGPFGSANEPPWAPPGQAWDISFTRYFSSTTWPLLSL